MTTTKQRSGAKKQTARKKEFDIKERLDKYLDLKHQVKELEKQMKEIKEKEIDPWCDQNIDQFRDNELIIDEYQVKVAKNPPKLVYGDSGSSVTREDKADLSEKLPEDCVSKQPSVSKMLQKFNADKSVKQLLKAKGLVIEQDTRYDVKPVK